MPGVAKHYTLFYVVPLGGNQSPCIFDNFREGILRWGVLGCPGEAMSDLSVLQNLGALQSDGIEFGEPSKDYA
jgi:hypothetical protein